MALVSVSSKCFNAIDAALSAVKAGDAENTTTILRSIRQDGLLLQREAKTLCERLKYSERRYQRQVEDLTRQMNNLYGEETKLEEKKRDLTIKKSSLSVAKDQHWQSWRQSQRRCSEARARELQAELRAGEARSLFWVPIVGQVLVVRELFENNSAIATVARYDATRHECDMNKSRIHMKQTNTAIRQATNKIFEVSRKVRDLKRQQEKFHRELGDVRNMTSFVMQAFAFWEDVVQLTKTATIKTEHLQKLIGIAAKRNTVRILRSSGTWTLVRSFKDCWIEVARMISSAENPLALNGKGQMLSNSYFTPKYLSVNN